MKVCRLKYLWYRLLELLIKGEKPYEVFVLDFNIWWRCTVRDLRPGDCFNTIMREEPGPVYVAVGYPRFVRDTDGRWRWRILTESKNIGRTYCWRSAPGK